MWTISKPLPYDVHLSGSGKAIVDVTTALPNANLVVDVYDLDANGTGPLVTRQGHLIAARAAPIALDLWSADWKLKAGHRIGVRVTDANQDWWRARADASRPSRSAAARSRCRSSRRRAPTRSRATRARS